MNKKIAYIIILLLFSIFYLYYGLTVETPKFPNLRIVGTVGLCQFVFSIFSSIKTGQKIISPYVLFLIAMYIFQTGQSLLYAFNIVSERDLVTVMDETYAGVFNAQLITFAFLAFFQIGSLCSRVSNPRSLTYYQDPEPQLHRLRIAGWIVATLTVYPYYKELINSVILTMTKGYGALYQQEVKIGMDNFLSVFADYFIPALICLFIGYKNKPIMRLAITAIFIINAILILLIGARSEAVIILGLILILYNYLIKAFTRKALVIIGGSAYVLLLVLSNIASVRGQTTKSMAEVINVEESDNSGAVEAIGEMGGSMYCLIETTKLIPEKEDYRYGTTYLYALTSIIPNVGFWDIHPAKVHANLDEWLTNTLELDFGTGYSMVAETYINFWLLGIFWMMFFGWIVSKVFGQLGVARSRNNMAYVTFVLIVFWFALSIPRSSFIILVRGIFYYALPFYWIARGYIIKQRY